MYDEHFVPNNATLALVGDITPARARELAGRYFARAARGPEPAGHMDSETAPVPGGAVRLDWMEPLTSRVMVRYRIPAVGHPDRPTFDLMAQVLSDRLGDALGGARGPATSVDASAGRRGAISTFTIDAYARRDQDLPLVESAILAAVERLHESEVPEEALQRARKALRLQWERTRSERGDLAFTLGHFEVMDSWRTLLAHMETRETATAADLQRLARKYFVPANRIVGTSRRQPLDRDAIGPMRTTEDRP
jgi:predicted Zn-dependent peptidase